VNIATGQQDRFSWSAVAASAIAAPIAVGVTQDALAGNPNPTSGDLFAARMAGAVTGAVWRTVLQGGTMNYTNIAADAFGNALGEALRDASRPSQQQVALGRAYEETWDRDDAELGDDMRFDQFLRNTEEAMNRNWTSPYEPLAAGPGGAAAVPLASGTPVGPRQVNVDVDRIAMVNGAVMSRVRVTADGRDVFLGWGLEPGLGDGGVFNTKPDSVAPGTYRLALENSEKFGDDIPTVVDAVAGAGRRMSSVLIHAGNVLGDTEGCLIVGNRADFVAG
jgi:hypothetical protein